MPMHAGRAIRGSVDSFAWCLASFGSKTNRDEREHLNLVFIGHVDAGKSTFCGQVALLLTRLIDILLTDVLTEPSW